MIRQEIPGLLVVLAEVYGRLLMQVSNWRNLTPDIPDLSVSVLAMAPSNHNIIYAGTGESMFNIDVINGDGLLKSTDKGETWNQITNTAGNLNFNNVSRIIVDPNNPNIVLASTSSGRYRQNFL